MTVPVRTSPPMYFPANFVLADAVTCATLVEVAYDQYSQWEEQGKPDRTDFNWTPQWPAGFTPSWVSQPPLWGDAETIFFAHPEPFGFIVQDTARRGFLVIRGTESDADWYKDLEVSQSRYALVTTPDFGRVQEGFLAVYASMRAAAIAAVDQIAPTSIQFFFTGHSLGSALVTLAVPDVMTNSALRSSAARIAHYNFASPRAGDPAFTSALDAMANVPTFRIVNTEDVVPGVPLAVTEDLLRTYYYKHAGMPVDFTAQYDTIGNNHSMLNCYLHAMNHPAQPEGPIAAPRSSQPALPGGLRKKTAPAMAPRALP